MGVINGAGIPRSNQLDWMACWMKEGVGEREGVGDQGFVESCTNIHRSTELDNCCTKTVEGDCDMRRRESPIR